MSFPTFVILLTSKCPFSNVISGGKICCTIKLREWTTTVNQFTLISKRDWVSSLLSTILSQSSGSEIMKCFNPQDSGKLKRKIFDVVENDPDVPSNLWSIGNSIIFHLSLSSSQWSMICIMTIFTKIIVVVSVIVVGIFNIHFKPHYLVAPCRDSVVKAHLHYDHNDDDDDDHDEIGLQ